MILYKKLQQGDSIDLPQVEIQGYDPYEYTEARAREAITGDLSGGVKGRPMPKTPGYNTTNSENWTPEYKKTRVAQMHYRDSLNVYNHGIQDAEWEAQQEYQRRIDAGEADSPEMLDEIYNTWLEPVLSGTPTEMNWKGNEYTDWGNTVDGITQKKSLAPIGVSKGDWVTDTTNLIDYDKDGLQIKRQAISSMLPSAAYYQKPTWPHGESEASPTPALEQRNPMVINPIHSRSGIGLNTDLDTSIQTREISPAAQIDPMRFRRHTRNVEGMGILAGGETAKRRQSGYMATDPYGDETFLTSQEYYDLNVTNPNYGGGNMHRR